MTLAVLAVAGVLHDCAGQSDDAARAIATLKQAVTQAQDEFPLTAEAQLGLGDSLPARSALQAALDDVPTGGLTAEDQSWVDLARSWDAAYAEVEDALRAVEAAVDQLPEEADALAASHANLEQVAAGDQQRFIDDVSDAVQESVKELMCTYAREDLDAEAERAAGRYPPVYPTLSSITDLVVESRIHAAVDRTWDTFDSALDLVGLASASVKTAQEYANGFKDIIDSPNGSIARANIEYFRLCVAQH